MTTNRSGNRTINQDQMQTKAITADVIKKINESKRTIDFVISSETPDRHGDIIMLKGWDTKQFMENPVVLFAHSKSVPPIAKALKVWKSGGNLNATAQFMTKELSPFADSIFNMFKEGFLKAVSVGFMPKEFELIQDDEGFIEGFKFIKQELLEFSAVPIPSNPDALIKARHKGIDVEPFGKWAEDMLDDWDNSGNMIRETYNIGKKQIENIRRKAIGETMTYQVPEDVQKELLAKNLKSIAEQKKAKEEKENSDTGGETSDSDSIYKLNRSAIAYANSLIEKSQVNIDDDIKGASFESKEHLSLNEDDVACHIIADDTLFRNEIVKAKQDSALNNNNDVFNAASKLLKKIDGEEIVKTNKYEDWDKDLPTKEFDPDGYEKLDIIQHTEDNVASIFFNNSPKETVIEESLFKSNGESISFIGSCDNLSIVLSGSNVDLTYYPYAKDEHTSYVCRLDSNMTSIPIVVTPNHTFESESITPNHTFESESITFKPDFKSSEMIATGPDFKLDFRVAKDSEEAYKKEMDKLLDQDSNLDEMKEKFVEDEDMTPMEQVNILDSILVDLEETLEKHPDLMSKENGDKRFIRKIKFVAQYMKDLANAISPVTTETTTTVEEGTIPVIFENIEDKVNDELTEEDIDKYLLENLGPTLDKIVKDSLNKIQGRLD